ncbi:MAG: Elongation factor P [uncultured bacterium (gcode 4)]|uniref:Elongation factor P n=1 Tax=uncultured bacterium (gcode 4) TaxID=1234023 RepID=K2F6Y6_9BACT|nr:MAG: Elongation factor P [uncultured bacterium (gcode 4)]
MAWMDDVKVGKKLLIDGIPYEVMKSEHLKVAMGKWMEKTNLKNLLNWTTMQKTFREVDKIEIADITYANAEYLYADWEGYNFMNIDTYEQFNLDSEVIWDSKFFLVEWDKVVLQEFNWKPINVQVEPAVALEVEDTPPWEKWDTATGWKKPAKLTTWLVVQVPLFVKNWDKVRVDTRTKEYLSRA